jgi:hypothetical protein
VIVYMESHASVLARGEAANLTDLRDLSRQCIGPLVSAGRSEPCLSSYPSSSTCFVSGETSRHPRARTLLLTGWGLYRFPCTSTYLDHGSTAGHGWRRDRWLLNNTVLQRLLGSYTLLYNRNQEAIKTIFRSV